MVERIICLGCGGVVDEGAGFPPGEQPCACPPPVIEARTVSCSSCGGALKVGARACPFCRSTLATRRCGSCFAWNLAEAKHCHACARVLTGEGGGAAAPELPCPRCQKALSARHFADLDVDECDACGGLFVSPTMMDRLVSERDSPTNLRLALPARAAWREAAVRYIPCPTCKKQMNRRAFGRISGVIVDVCRDHGVWFDAGELTQVLAFIERGGLAAARAREAEEAAEATRAARSAQLRNSTAMPHRGDLSAGTAGRIGQTQLEMAAELVQMFAELWR